MASELRGFACPLQGFCFLKVFLFQGFACPLECSVVHADWACRVLGICRAVSGEKCIRRMVCKILSAVFMQNVFRRAPRLTSAQLIPQTRH